MRAVLIGPIQQENLALGYLAGSARKAGHEASLVAYAYRADLDAAIAATLAEKPDLVGLGIAFQNNIDDYLELVRELRKRGFRGHLTAGGHVPTFCYEELLRDLPELDSVVRHDGEETLVEMLHKLEHGEPLTDIRGLVWRDGDSVVKGEKRGTLADLDSLPWPLRGTEPYSVGGIVVDFLITARGCVGECNYCSIAAYTSEQKMPFRLRKPPAVAEEIAALYHGHGARVMFVQDDLFVLPSEKKTLERVEGIRNELERRNVGELVFWVKGRPETISPTVARALREMGAIHMFLGVENASAARLDYLGRTHLPLHNDSAIDNCRRAGIVPSFNFMLFDPDCTLDDVASTLCMAEQHLDLPWNVCRTEIYSGTALRKRLEEEGRLQGNYRSFGYRARDERAEIMFRILRVSFHERALAIESLLNRLISLSFARQLHDHFFPGEGTRRLSDCAVSLGIEIRRDTLRALRELHAFASKVDVRDEVAVRRFAMQQALELGRLDGPWRKQTNELWEHYTTRGTLLMHKRGVLVPNRARHGFGVAAGS
jgi:anaerobic magnesium-protoporphyrin IX monomethyl ester cyclase